MYVVVNILIHQLLLT